ncbi:hypothetical protein FPV67DRAFT_514808 [Lyophyllum atratum]|nr:hypothetical protein FPV67DRAFT_514808 [Lyophyllum atratum]
MPEAQCQVVHEHGSALKPNGDNYRTVQPTQSDDTNNQAKDFHGRGHSQRDQREVYLDAMKYTQYAVRLQIELDAAQAEFDRWKRTQLSIQFSRATPATRKILDDQRAKFGKSVTDLRTNLTNAFTALSDLPDLGTHLQALSSEIEHEQLETYSAELRKWIISIKDFDSRPRPAPISQTMDPMRWTEEQLEVTIDTIGKLAADAMENFYTRRFTNIDIDDIPSTATALFERSTKKQKKLAEMENRVGNEPKTSETTKLVAQLKAKLSRGKAELAELYDKLRELENTQVEMRLHLDQCKEWQQEDSKRIQGLATQIQLLKTLRKPLPTSTLEEMLPMIRKVVKSTLEETEGGTQGVAEQIRAACKENNRALIEELHARLQPTLDTTALLFERVRMA